MSAQSYEIRCPACGEVVPIDARQCPNCAGRQTRRTEALAAVAAGPEPTAPDLAEMKLKEYHRFVRANYRTVEAPRMGASSSSSTAKFLPFALLLIGLVVAAVVLHPF